MANFNLGSMNYGGTNTTSSPITTVPKSTVDIYGQGNRNAANQPMIDYLKSLQTQMAGEQWDKEQAGGGVYIGDEAQNELNNKYMQQAASQYGWNADQIKGVNPSLLADVMQYNGVNDPQQAMKFLQDYTNGLPAGVATAGAGNRDGIAYALANGLGVDEAHKFNAKYQDSISESSRAMGGLIKAGVGTLFAAGAGNAAGLWDLGGAATTSGGAGTSMFAPETLGQSFVAPEALTGVESIPNLASTVGTTAPGAGSSMYSLAGGTGTLGSASAAGTSAGMAGSGLTASTAPTVAGMGGTGVTGTLAATVPSAAGSSGFLSNLGSLKDIAKAGSSLYSAYKGQQGAQQTQDILNNQMTTLADMYKEGSPWANQLKEQLARKDAAAGRNSQYGSRLAQYQALLADQAGKNAGVLGQLATQAGAANKDSNGYLNLLLNRAGDLADSTGLSKYVSSKAEEGIKTAWDYFLG